MTYYVQGSSIIVKRIHILETLVLFIVIHSPGIVVASTRLNAPSATPATQSQSGVGRHTPVPLRGLISIKIYTGAWGNNDRPVGTTYEIITVRPPITVEKVTQAGREYYGVDDSHSLYGADGIKIPASVESQG